jgi:hypothetical protein
MRRIAAHHLEGFSRETISRSSVASIRTHEVEKLAMPVDRSEQILPALSNPHVGLIHTPRTGKETLDIDEPVS